MTVSIATLPAAVAYRLWAPTYDVENGITHLDELAVARLSPPAFTRLLDAACGTGRRIRGEGRAVGVDLVPEMLARATSRGRLGAGDVLRLPFTSGAFDLVWCRLAVGHVEDVAAFYREIARVLAPGGAAVVTDVHPAAIRAGLKRDFRGPDGTLHEVEHHVHDALAHHRAALACGLFVEALEELAVGEEIRHFFVNAGAGLRYERERGLPVVLALRLRRAR